MRKIMYLFLSLVLVIILTGCGNKIEKQNQNKNKKELNSSLVNIEKVYYQVSNDSSASMYIVYSVKSDDKKDITLGDSADLTANSETTGSAFYSYDMNKNFIGSLGFPTLVDYKTLYGGSEDVLKYVATFVINKRIIDDNEKIILRVPYNGEVSKDSPVTKNKYLEKSFKFDEIDSFEYSDNEEFIKEFEKDYK